MTPQQLSRLERVETFIQRLTLGSYLAKAAGEGGRVIGNRQTREPDEQNLARTVTGDDTDPLAALQRRVKQLEQLVRDLVANPTGQPSPIAQGEATLAKAVLSFHDGESLLAYADAVISDPTQVGVVASYVSAGDFKSAQNAVLEATERSTLAKAPDLMAQVATTGSDSDLASYETRAGVSELLARFGKLEQLMASFEVRLSQLEQRPQAAQASTGQVMAKASGPKGKRTKEETEARLMAQIHAYIDSASVVGQLSSMVQSGQYAEVRRVLTGAKQAHDAAKIASERKHF